jgi:hypothetical protein
MIKESNRVFLAVGSFRDNAFGVKVVCVKEDGLELFRFLVFCLKTRIIKVHIIDFFLGGMFGLIEKNAETAYQILKSFRLIDFFVIGDSALFCSPSEVKAVTNELCVLKVKFMQLFTDYFDFFMLWSLLFDIEKFFAPFKSCVLIFPTDSVPNVTDLLQQINLLILDVFRFFHNFLKDLFFDIFVAGDDFPDFDFILEFEDAITDFGNIKVAVVFGVFS